MFQFRLVEDYNIALAHINVVYEAVTGSMVSMHGVYLVTV